MWPIRSLRIVVATNLQIGKTVQSFALLLGYSKVMIIAVVSLSLVEINWLLFRYKHTFCT